MDVDATQDSLSIRFSALSESGGQPLNEDTCFAVAAPGAALVIIADGVGGQARGEVASDLAATTAREYLTAGSDRVGLEAIEAALRAAHARVREAVAASPRARTMRTTLLIAQATRHELCIGHVGDCRAYLVRDGVATQLTRDDTLVQTLLDLGQIDVQAARTHAKANVLLQSLGDPKDLDFHMTGPVEMHDGDVVITCSDGLSDVLDSDEIAACVGTNMRSCDQVVQGLMRAALLRHAPDNVSIGAIVWRKSRRGVYVAARRHAPKRTRRRDPFARVALALTLLFVAFLAAAAVRRRRSHRTHSISSRLSGSAHR